jgi:hypothetical protein
MNSSKTKISIVSLIYRSTKFADAVYESIQENTEKLKTGEAKFFFVANDPEPHLLKHLKDNNYPFVLHENKKKTEKELFNVGIGGPEYINRVYLGWNRAIKESDSEIVVLVNSDNMFSPNWLENLLKNLNEDTFVCSEIVERPNHPKFAPFPGCLVGDFGNHPDNFKKEEFLQFVDANQKIKKGKTKTGGAYMPCAFYREKAIEVGLYPEGNLHDGTNFMSIEEYGDENFVKKLSRNGVRHITSLDSISYHFKEGEMLE